MTGAWNAKDLSAWNAKSISAWNGSTGIATGVSLAPLDSDITAWWDNRSADFSLSSGLVDTWTDRKNGLIQTGTTTTRPTVLVGPDGRNYVNFANDYLSLPAGFSINQRACSVFVFIRRGLATTNSCGIFTAGTANGFNLHTSGQEIRHFNGGGNNSAIYSWHSLVTVEAIGNGATNCIIGAGKETFNAAANAAASPTGGRIGEWTGTPPVFPLEDGDIVGILVYGRILNSTERNQVKDWASSYYKTQSRLHDKVLVTEGDSITWGQGATNIRYWSWPARVAQSMASEFRYVNVATAGQHINGLATTRAVDKFTKSTAYTTKVLTILIGTNDIGSGGRTSAQVLTDITNYITSIRVSVSGLIVVGMTILPRAGLGGTEQTHLTATNIGILANTPGYDHIIDVASDPNLDDPNDAAIYPDGLHPSDLGYGHLSAAIKTYLVANSLI